MGLFGLTIGVHTSNIINIGGELAGTSNLALVASFEIFFAGLGGLTGPPVASKSTNILSKKQVEVECSPKYTTFICSNFIFPKDQCMLYSLHYDVTMSRKRMFHVSNIYLS